MSLYTSTMVTREAENFEWGPLTTNRRTSLCWVNVQLSHTSLVSAIKWFRQRFRLELERLGSRLFCNVSVLFQSQQLNVSCEHPWHASGLCIYFVENKASGIFKEIWKSALFGSLCYIIFFVYFITYLFCKCFMQLPLQLQVDARLVSCRCRAN